MMTESIKKLKTACRLCRNTATAPAALTALTALAALSLTACADWDDHYEAGSSLLGSQQATLWQNIEQAPQLTQFATLLRKAGYDATLGAPQTYTVWAPVDGSFDYDAMAALTPERLQKEFIGNHIARNNYPASGHTEENVYTLNEKRLHFTGNGQYSIEGIALSQPNIAAANGTLHAIGARIPFMQNIYESLNNYEHPIDSVSNYYHSYDQRRLNEQKSVQGPTLNGEITYLDSIFDESNTLFNDYRAYINREDSNYSMIVPTNEAWRKAKAVISSYYRYPRSFEFMENTSTGSDKKKVTVTLSDVDYLRDSIVHQMLTGYLCFNNNLDDNRRLDSYDGSGTLVCDSLYSTTLMKIYGDDAAALFEGTTRIRKSNGYVWLTDDSLRMRHWSAWNPELRIQAENSNVIASTSSVYNNEPQRQYVAPGTQNPDVSGQLSRNAYLEVQPVSQSTNPGVVFYLPGVRSTTYSIYIVTVPANITNARAERKPNRFTVSMGYNDENGKNIDNERSWVEESFFVNDSAQIDTVYLGDFTFPMAYAGTGDYYPYIRVNSQVASRDRLKYDRTMRIDCIILRPKELDDFIKQHPGYKYDQGLY